MAAMNNDTPNYVQQHVDNFYNVQISAQNFHASRSQLPYVDSHERSMFANAGDVANMDCRLSNKMGNYVSGGNIGKQLNVAAGLRASGHLTHPNSILNEGPGHINVLGTNISMEAMQAQGLLQRQNAGMYHQNQHFSMQKEDFPALPGFRGSTMDYPVEMHTIEQLHDYTLPQLQLQHLSAGPTAGFMLANPYLPHHQQQVSPAITGAGISILQANNDNRLRSPATDLLPSRLASYHSAAHNMELGAAGTKPLNPAGTGSGQYDEILHQYELHKQNQLQVQQMQSADTFNNEDRTPKWTTQHPIDPYGMLGLLHVMKLSRPIPVSAHALGIDLTTLGLNLTQPDDLHKDFLSPFSEKSVKDVQDRQFMVPDCYNTNRAEYLQPSLFPYFRLVTLFYIFYSMPNDMAQLYAAHELMNREWLYHKEHRLWLMRNKKTSLLVKTDTYERGAFIFFDPKEWKVIHQDNFVLKYESIEKRPALPIQPGRI